MPDISISVLHELEVNEERMNNGYTLWYRIYVIFVILTVGLPAVAAIGLFHAPIAGCSPTIDNILAGAGALFAALSHAIKPHEFATGFDAGLQRIWKARIRYVAGAIDEQSAAEEIGKAIDLVTFRYGGKGL